MLEWLALISDRHDRKLREIQLLEAKQRLVEQRSEHRSDLLDLQEAEWDPAKHPRRGSAPNPGWFATTQGTSSGTSSPRPSDASASGQNKSASASAPADVTPSIGSRDVNQEAPSTERKKLPVAPAIHPGGKQVEVQQVASGGGHHWVPQSAFSNLKGRMTEGAYKLFAAGTKSTDPYKHGFDTWGGVTHREYINGVHELLDDWIRTQGGKLSEDGARRFLTWIANGECNVPEFAAKHKKLLEKVFRWRKGFLQSIVVAHAAAEINPKLTAAELKSIAQQVVNGKPTQPLSKAAAKAAKSLISGGKPLLKAAAKKILPGLVFFSTAAAAKRGWSGQGHTGDGAWGAFNEVTRDIVIADVVEPVVFPAVLTTVDGITNVIAPGLNAPGRKRYIRRGGRVLDLETGRIRD